MITAIKIIKGEYNKGELKYNVQLWHDNTYCGDGRFCKDYNEAKQYIIKRLTDKEN